ncbi:MAG: hypothetical protein ACRESS_04920 [Stenotrophobium sp.]
MSVLVTTLLAGCASSDYRQAFNEANSLQGNSRVYAATEDRAQGAVIGTYVKSGFTIKSAGQNVVTAERTIQDKGDTDVSYLITSSAVVAPLDADSSSVSLSASQQTVLHRKSYDWWHLLWIIPLFPVGTEYQTVVTSESTVDDPAFYTGFLNDLGKTLPPLKAAENGTPIPPPPALVVEPPATPSATQDATGAAPLAQNPAAQPAATAEPGATSNSIPESAPPVTTPSSSPAPAN